MRQTSGGVEHRIGVYRKAVDLDGGEFFLVVEQDLFYRADQAPGTDMFFVGALGEEGEGLIGKFDIDSIGAKIALFGPASNPA